MLKFIALTVAVLAAAAMAYAATRPDTFEVSRSRSIAAPPEKIFPLINDLHAFNTWNPFLRHDPATKIEYSGPQSGKGAAHAWDGNSQVGKGRIEITESQPATKVGLQLDMLAPMEAHNQVMFTLEPAGQETVVTWAMAGKSNFKSKLMSVIFDMDKMVGGEFDRGLDDLKKLAESVKK